MISTEMEATVKFADGSTLTIRENQHLIPCIYTDYKGINEPVKMEGVKIKNHTNEGLLPALVAFFDSCKYFYVHDNSSTVYFTGAIVSITG